MTVFFWCGKCRTTWTNGTAVPCRCKNWVWMIREGDELSSSGVVDGHMFYSDSPIRALPKYFKLGV